MLQVAYEISRLPDSFKNAPTNFTCRFCSVLFIGFSNCMTFHNPFILKCPLTEHLGLPEEFAIQVNLWLK